MRAPGINYFFPLHIPQGKRIAAQISCFTASRIFGVSVWLLGGGVPAFRTGRKVTTLGTKASNSQGAPFVPGTSGAVSTTEIVASTSEDYFAILPGYQVETDTAWGTQFMHLGVGIGASTEQRLGTWIYSHSSTEENFGPSPPFPAFKPIPSGSRLTVLASNSGGNETVHGTLFYAVS